MSRNIQGRAQEDGIGLVGFLGWGEGVRGWQGEGEQIKSNSRVPLGHIEGCKCLCTTVSLSARLLETSCYSSF